MSNECRDDSTIDKLERQIFSMKYVLNGELIKVKNQLQEFNTFLQLDVLLTLIA
jgi:hypothetical protein